MSIILSIKPKWAEKIYSGEKTVEWRKTFPSQIFEENVKARVYLYETAPVSKITGWFTLGEIRAVKITASGISSDAPNTAEILKAGCIDLEALKEYLGDHETLYAWAVTRPAKLNPGGVELSRFGIAKPPQSWMYYGQA